MIVGLRKVRKVCVRLFIYYELDWSNSSSVRRFGAVRNDTHQQANKNKRTMSCCCLRHPMVHLSKCANKYEQKNVFYRWWW